MGVFAVIVVVRKSTVARDKMIASLSEDGRKRLMEMISAGEFAKGIAAEFSWNVNKVTGVIRALGDYDQWREKSLRRQRLQCIQAMNGKEHLPREIMVARMPRETPSGLYAALNMLGSRVCVLDAGKETQRYLLDGEQVDSTAIMRAAGMVRK